MLVLLRGYNYTDYFDLVVLLATSLPLRGFVHPSVPECGHQRQILSPPEELAQILLVPVIQPQELIQLGMSQSKLLLKMRIYPDDFLFSLTATLGLSQCLPELAQHALD